MKTFNEWKKKEILKREMLESNKEMVLSINIIQILNMTFILTVLSAIAVVICLILPRWRPMLWSMVAAFTVALTFFVMARRVMPKRKDLVLPFTYIHLALLFGISIYHSIAQANTGGTIIAFISLLLMLPMTIIDKFSHMVIFITGICSAFTISYLACIPLSGAIDGVLNCWIFAIFGLFIGDIICETRLSNIENQRLLAIQRDIDILTGLPNRRKLIETIKNDKLGEITSAMMIDVDFFKKYNDTYGHRAGDRCLMMIGECLWKITVEGKCQIFRFGGEEFTVLSKSLDYEGLEKLAKMVVNGIRELRIPFESSPEGFVTVSVGFAQWDNAREKSWEELLNMADKALYEAKGKGRNTAMGKKIYAESV